MYRTHILSISVLFLILKFSDNFPMIESKGFEVLRGALEFEVCNLSSHLKFSCFQNLSDVGSSSTTLHEIHDISNNSIKFSTKTTNVTMHMDVNCENSDLHKLIGQLWVTHLLTYKTNFTCTPVLAENAELVNNVLQSLFQELIDGYQYDNRFQECCSEEGGELENSVNTATNSSICWDITEKHGTSSSIEHEDCGESDTQQYMAMMLMTLVIAVIIVFSLIVIYGVYKRGKRMMVELENDTQHRSRIQPGFSMSTVNLSTADDSPDLEDSDDIPMPNVTEMSDTKPTTFPMIGNPLSRKRSTDSHGYAIPDLNSNRENIPNGHYMTYIPEDDEGYMMPNQQSHPRTKVIGYFTRVPSVISESDA